MRVANTAAAKAHLLAMAIRRQFPQASTVLGFTGSRDGMTQWQEMAARAFVWGSRHAVAAHGCCVGADEEFSRMRSHASLLSADSTGWRPCHVLSLPCVGYPELVSKDAVGVVPEDWPELRPLQRNDVIVALSDHILACPPCATDPGKGGTWYTIRRAIKKRVPVTIIAPDGTFTHRLPER